MNARRPEPDQKKVVATERLKDDLWSAYSASGDLHWVTQPEVLDALSTAYYRIRVVVFLEQRFFDAAHFPGLRTAHPENAIMKYLDQGDAKALNCIERALAVVDKGLEGTA